MEMKSLVVAMMLSVVSVSAFGEVIRVVREPRLVPTVSSKTEKAWANCRWCGGKISYERTYRWDAYERQWNETTKNVPDTCRKCRSRDREIERLQREEANLDRKLELKETKKRVAEKREQLRNWTSNR